MRPLRPKTPRRNGPKAKMPVKDPIVVYCRIRPLENEDDPSCLRVRDEKSVVLFTPEDAPLTRNMRDNREIICGFARVFGPKTTQKQLFDHVCFPLVQDLLQGSNGLLFTYGITSSGKTYTVSGTPYDGGVLPRCLDVIFNSIKDVQAAKFVFKPDKMNGFDIQTKVEAMQDLQKEMGIISRTPKPSRRKENIGDWTNRVTETSLVEDLNGDVHYGVFVSYVEIYNNYIYDLLEDSSIDPIRKNQNSKMLREDPAHNMYVFGVNETEVKSADEALELFYKGQLKRRVSSTILNNESSRSHSVFTIRVVQAPLDLQGAEILQDKDQVIVSQLSIVDLAGSERSTRTKVVGHKIREAGNINASLMALRTCIEALREAQTQASSRMIPYRESKLTHLFKMFFEGEGKIRMIVCVNPQSDNFEETFHVMKFAEVTQEIMIARPTPVKTPVVAGLRSGRGNLYREALTKAKQQGVPVEEFIAPAVYAMGEFPQLIFQMSDDELVYVNLIDFLEGRMARRNTYLQDLERRQEDFRTSLIAFDKEHIRMKEENIRLQMDLGHREQQTRCLEQKLARSEENFEVLSNQLQEIKRKLERTEETRAEEHREISSLKRNLELADMRTNEKVASERERCRRIMEKRTAKIQAQLGREVCLSQEKFRQLREILNHDDCDFQGDFAHYPVAPPSVTSTESSDSSAPVTTRSRKSQRRSTEEPPPTEVKIPRIKSALDFYESRNTPQASGSQVTTNDFDTVLSKENKAPGSSQRSVAIANLRHRRSHSCSEEKWIEHKPVGNLELNTVLQPKMRRKKSVSKLQVKDVTTGVSKYILQHQEQDSQGEMETQYFKGNILPSTGGGAQVVFDEVEKLRQTSPPSTKYNLRKRSQESLPLRDIEDRCAVSVECHGLPSKVLKKK